MLRTTISLLLLGVAAASGPDGEALVNDLIRVQKINAVPGILWKAGFNARFDGKPLRDVKSLAGVKASSHGAVQKLNRVKSGIPDEAVPDSFDSETNWPQCASIIGDIRDQ